MNKKDIEQALDELVSLAKRDASEPDFYIDQLKQTLQSALDDCVFDGKCAKCNNRIYIKNGFVRQPSKDKEEVAELTRTDTIPKQKAVDVEKMVKIYEEEREKYLGGTSDYYPNNQAAFEGAMRKALDIKSPESSDKDRVMQLMAEALNTCEWIRDENGHDWPRYDEEKVSQALKEYDRLKASDETAE